MEVFVDHVRVGGADVTSSTFGDVSFMLDKPTFVGELTVVYTNDGNAGGCDHNLYVDHVTLSGGATISTADTEHVLFDKMSASGLATAFDGVDVSPASSTMAVNGGLRFFIGATGHLSGLEGPPGPVFSTKTGARFTNSANGSWEFTGERLSLSAPLEHSARYRIAFRQMFTSTSGMAYCLMTLSASTAGPGNASVTGLGVPHGNPTAGFWQTLFSEGYYEVPAGQTVQLNVSLISGGGGLCTLANGTADGDAFTNVIAWPL